ncbi:hypothetical protein MY8738_000616 [Beauveria namnaoensis]
MGQIFNSSTPFFQMSLRPRLARQAAKTGSGRRPPDTAGDIARAKRQANKRRLQLHFTDATSA